MKKLILGVSSLLLLAIQVNAWQSPNANVTNNSNHNSVTKSYEKTTVTVNGDTKINSLVGVTYNLNTQDDQDGPEKSKTFSKSFSVDRNDKINLSNQFGTLTIKTWDKNEIKVDADIKAYATSDSEAQKMLDQTNITASKEGDNVSFRTNIEDRNGNWGSGNRNGVKWRHEVKIYMTVYMPAVNNLTASQQYGTLTLGDFSGPTSLKVQYGSLVAGDLKNISNNINVQYCKTTIQDVGSATVKAQYGGGLTMGNIGNIDLNAQYISVNIGNVKGNAEVKHQYGGGITIASIGGALDLNAQYVRIKVGTLSGNLKAKVQYGGGLAIDHIESGSKAIDVDTQYAPVNLGFANNYNADFNTSVSYNSFKYGENITAKREGGDDRSYSSTKTYNGQIGKGGSAKVSVSAQYSSITFK